MLGYPLYLNRLLVERTLDGFVEYVFQLTDGFLAIPTMNPKP